MNAIAEDISCPGARSAAAWNAARDRVQAYLLAHRVDDRGKRSQLTQRILERAADRQKADPALNPTEAAMEETEGLMEDWFARVLDRPEMPGDRLAIEGRMALLLCDGARNWPAAFLEDGPLPVDFEQAMRAPALQSGPDLALSSMVLRPIDLGPITDAAGETLKRIDRWPFLRMAVVALIVAGTLAAIF